MPAATPPALIPILWRSGADIARAVRSARERLRLTPTQLAHRARVSRMFLYQLEAGKNTVRADKALAVLAALGVQAMLVPGAPPR